MICSAAGRVRNCPTSVYNALPSCDVWTDGLPHDMDSVRTAIHIVRILSAILFAVATFINGVIPETEDMEPATFVGAGFGFILAVVSLAMFIAHRTHVQIHPMKTSAKSISKESTGDSQTDTQKHGVAAATAIAAGIVGILETIDQMNRWCAFAIAVAVALLSLIEVAWALNADRVVVRKLADKAEDQ